MKRHWKLLSTMGLIAGVLLAGSNAQAASPAPEYAWRLTSGAAPTEPAVLACGFMGELLESRSKGRIKLRIYPLGELGPARETVEMVRTGTLDFFMGPPPYSAHLIPWSSVFDLPFLFRNFEEAWGALDTWVGGRVAEAYEKHGIKLIASFDLGMRSFFSRKVPILKPEDLRGMKFRVMPSPVLPRVIEAWGGKPVALDFGEVYSALETGVIDAMDLPPPGILSTKYYEVSKFLTVSNHSYTGGFLIMTKKTFDGLPKDIQELLMKCGLDATNWSRSQGVRETASSIDKLAKLGMKVNYMDPDQIQRFKKMTKPVYTWAAGQYGKELVERLVGPTE